MGKKSWIRPFVFSFTPRSHGNRGGKEDLGAQNLGDHPTPVILAHDSRDMADCFPFLTWQPAEIAAGERSDDEVFQRLEFTVKVEERAAGPMKRRIHQRGGISWCGSLPISTLWDRTSHREVRIGAHPAAWRSDMFIDEMTGATIHPELGKGAWETNSRPSCFQKVHHGITGREEIVHLSSGVEIGLEELCKTGFTEQPLSDVGFGARRAGSKY